MSGQLKSPVNTMFVMLWFSIFPGTYLVRQGVFVLCVAYRMILLVGLRCFSFLLYLKPDIICATESWLKGVKPGVNPTIDAIKSCEIFPPNHVFLHWCVTRIAA
jgi:hypothetical protein